MTCAHATVAVANECGENCCGVVTCLVCGVASKLRDYRDNGDSFEPGCDEPQPPARLQAGALSLVPAERPPSDPAPALSQTFIDAMDAVEHLPGANLAVDEASVPGALVALRCWAIVRHLSLVERDVAGYPGCWVLACDAKGIRVHATAEHRRLRTW